MTKVTCGDEMSLKHEFFLIPNELIIENRVSLGENLLEKNINNNGFSVCNGRVFRDYN